MEAENSEGAFSQRK